MDANICNGDHASCQVFNLNKLAEPGKNVEVDKRPLRYRVRLVLRRTFSPSAKRKIKGYLNTVAVAVSRAMGKREIQSASVTDVAPIAFNRGDKVLVRSKDQIQATLNYWNELKGCSFLPEMWPYCGTIQRVLKPVKRFVDERDCRVKKVNGVYLLEGIMCQGFELYGECDRSCFYFWRQEWLEKISE